MAGRNGLNGAMARKTEQALSAAMAQISLNGHVERKDLAPVAPANVVLFPEADITTIAGFARKTPEEAAKAKAPAMVKLEQMENEVAAIKARHPEHSFELNVISKRDLERGSLDRLDKAEDRRHKARVANLALRRQTLLALEEGDGNMRAIYAYYAEAEKAQNPGDVEARNKAQRKQQENARAVKCEDQRKSKRRRAAEEEEEGDEDEYDVHHQVRDVEEDDVD